MLKWLDQSKLKIVANVTAADTFIKENNSTNNLWPAIIAE